MICQDYYFCSQEYQLQLIFHPPFIVSGLQKIQVIFCSTYYFPLHIGLANNASCCCSGQQATKYYSIIFHLSCSLSFSVIIVHSFQVRRFINFPFFAAITFFSFFFSNCQSSALSPPCLLPIDLFSKHQYLFYRNNNAASLQNGFN